MLEELLSPCVPTLFPNAGTHRILLSRRACHFLMFIKKSTGQNQHVALFTSSVAQQLQTVTGLVNCHLSWTMLSLSVSIGDVFCCKVPVMVGGQIVLLLD